MVHSYDEQSDSFTCRHVHDLTRVASGCCTVRTESQVWGLMLGIRRRLTRVPGNFRGCTRDVEIGRSLAMRPGQRCGSWSLGSRLDGGVGEAQQAYKVRKLTGGASVSCIIKQQQGARRFRLRGLTSVAATSGACWPLPSTCALCGGPDAAAGLSNLTPRAESPPSFLILTAAVITLRYTQSPPSKIRAKRRSVNPTCSGPVARPTNNPLHHFWDRLH